MPESRFRPRTDGGLGIGRHHGASHRSTVLLTATVILAALAVAPTAVRAQTAHRGDTHVGILAGSGLLLGEPDHGDGLLDLPRFLGLTVHRIRDDSGLGLRADAIYAWLDDDNPTAELDARTSMVTVLAGPVLQTAWTAFTPYVHPFVGGAATVLSGTTRTGPDPGDVRNVGDVTFTYAYGLSAGLRLALDEAGRRPSLDIGVRAMDFGPLTFVRPRTDTFVRNSAAIELRLGLTVVL